MDYDINYLLTVLNNIKSNPYSIKYTNHYVRKSNLREVDRGLVDKKLLSEIPVGIQKTFGYYNRFELIYEFNNNNDLYIVIDIVNLDEIIVITVIPKDINRRKH